MKNTKNSKKTKEPVETKEQKIPTKFGILGKDLSSQFSKRSDRARYPTTRGGRNGQGKP